MSTTRTKFKFRGFIVTLKRTELFSGLTEYPEFMDAVTLVSPVGVSLPKEFESVEEAIEWILSARFSQQ